MLQKSDEGNLIRQKEHFEKIAQQYYLARHSDNHLLFKNLLWNYFLNDKNCLKKEGALVLEPMCGFGEGKEILEKHLKISVNYEGFDYSQNLVDLVKNNSDLNVYLLDVTKFIPCKKCDLIILIGGLHHVYKNAFDVVKNLSCSLNKGGFFINFEPTHNNFIFRKIRERIYKKNSFFDEQTERAFELNELNQIFLSNDFEIVDQIYPGLLSYILYYNPDAFPKLNLGSSLLVKALFSIDKLFFRNFGGKKFSFATLTLYRKI